MERLDKTVSKAGGISRSETRGLILRGLVTVDGETVRDISFKVDPVKQKICLNGRSINYKEFCYIVMNKPKGVISACEDKRTETVIDLLPDRYKNRKLFPVGRLDKDTTGLLIITDDGDFAHKLLSPAKKVPKEYLVTLDGQTDSNLKRTFSEGVTLADGTKLSSAEIRETEEKNVVSVKITEGKYHQIKRMFGVFGLGVNELKRISFGGLLLPKDLESGKSRELNDNEMSVLLKAAGYNAE